jgi:hypothetical protein
VTSPSLYPGFNVMLMGPSGTGKTFSLASLTKTGLEVFVLFVEPGVETLVGAYVDPKPEGQGLDDLPPNLHWHFLKPQAKSLKSLSDTAEAVGKFDQSTLAKMKDNDRGKHNQTVALYSVLNNFVDQRTGESFGPVDNWGTDRVLVIDSLSALGDIMWDMVVGAKPLRDKPDYQLVQTNLTNLIQKLTDGCLVNFVLIAHVDRMVDDVMGGVKLMPVTPGQAMKGTLPQRFSDVILTARMGKDFYWDTANGQADLKTRNLKIESKLPPDFGPIVEKWRKRKAIAELTQSSNSL